MVALGNVAHTGALFMYQTLVVRIRGMAPIIPHNNRLANPFDPLKKEMSKLTTKRKKTDDDYAEMARIEWHAGLYVDGDGRAVVPGENIEGMLCEAGKKLRSGKQVKAGLISDGSWPIIHDGPKKIEALWADETFRDIRAVKNKGSGGTVMRCRPIFNKWELEFRVSYMPDVLDKDTIKQMLDIASSQIGLLDYRPRFGRFEVVSLKEAA